jgi:hypothetical protein
LHRWRRRLPFRFFAKIRELMKALGLTIPKSIVLRADEVIE